MALRWFDGFDYYATVDLTSNYNIVGGSFQIATGAGRFSSGALRNGSGGGSEVLTRFFPAQATWIVGVAYKFSAGGIETTLISFSLDATRAIELRMTTGNILRISRNGTTVATGTTSLLSATFYYIEFKVDLATGNCSARVNGIAEVSVTGGTMGAATANRVTLHYDAFNVINTYDDYYICDTSGSASNDFLGDMRVETLVPSAVGTYQEWDVTGASGNAVNAVNEATPDGDTSYISTGTVDDRQTYNFPDLASTPSAIAGIKLTAIARKDDAGLRAITPLFRIDSTDYLGSAIGVGDSYSYLAQIFPTNPDTTVPWTGADINALEAGWKTT